MRYLDECIESVKIQRSENVDVEHMIVDGGSTDGTLEFARRRGCTVMTGKDEGTFDAINKGSFAAQGELLGFLGCDDILLPGALEQVVQTYERSGRRWVGGGIRWLDGRGTPRGDLAAPPRWINMPMFASLGWNCIMHMATYVNSELFRELGGFRKEMKYAGDYDFFLGAVAIEPFARIGRTLACFRRRHGDNQSMSITPKHRTEIDAVERQFGPSREWKKQYYRYLLKFWLNATNPSWFACKRIDALRTPRAGLTFQD